MKLKMLPARAQLTLPDGSEVEVEKLGRGRYTTAWRNCENVYTQTHEKDSGKELLSRLEANPHLPAVKVLEWGDGASPYRWFKMPLYRPLKAGCTAWLDFKVLRQLRDTAWRQTDHGGYGRNITADEDAYKFNAKFAEMIEGCAALPEPLKEAVRQLLDECANYGAYIIEISKRNCAVSDEGKLILLDPVFDLAEVRRGRK